MFTQVELEEERSLMGQEDIGEVLYAAQSCLTDVFDELLSIKYLIEGI